MRATGQRRLALSAALTAILLLLAMGAWACGGSSPSGGATTTGGVITTSGQAGAQVMIKDFAFVTVAETFTIKVGESVTWTNEDSVNHTVAGDNGEFESGSLGNGQSFTFTFPTAGTFTYHCTVHPSMKGTVVVQ